MRLISRIFLAAAVVLGPTVGRGQIPPPCNCVGDWTTYAYVVDFTPGAGWLFSWTINLGLSCDLEYSTAKPSGQCQFQNVTTIRIWSANGWIPVSFTAGGTSAWTQPASVACATDEQMAKFSGTNWFCPSPASNTYLLTSTTYPVVNGNLGTRIWFLQVKMGSGAGGTQS